ncbi:MAG: hypothetical protein ACHQ0J_04985 [Candidatus Dormibacterales bacterium]
MSTKVGPMSRRELMAETTEHLTYLPDEELRQVSMLVTMLAEPDAQLHSYEIRDSNGKVLMAMRPSVEMPAS